MKGEETPSSYYQITWIKPQTPPAFRQHKIKHGFNKDHSVNKHPKSGQKYH
jgi:hypothetical protein